MDKPPLTHLRGLVFPIAVPQLEKNVNLEVPRTSTAKAYLIFLAASVLAHPPAINESAQLEQKHDMLALFLPAIDFPDKILEDQTLILLLHLLVLLLQPSTTNPRHHPTGRTRYLRASSSVLSLIPSFVV